SSSTAPSQSLSIPSHSSADGNPGVQETTPASQEPVAKQAPVPQVGVTSSTDPSQSLSMPSQISTDGEPGAPVSTRWPPWQVGVPEAAQAPTPQIVGRGATSSSMRPSQSSS